MATKGLHIFSATLTAEFYFKIKEQSEAKYVSENIGSARVERTATSDNTSAGTGFMNVRDGDSESQQITSEAAFSPEEIMSLPTGYCVPDIAGLDKGKDCHLVGLVQFKLQDKLQHKNEPFADYYKELEVQERKREDDEQRAKMIKLEPEPTQETEPKEEQKTIPEEATPVEAVVVDAESDPAHEESTAESKSWDDFMM